MVVERINIFKESFSLTTLFLALFRSPWRIVAALLKIYTYPTAVYLRRQKKAIVIMACWSRAGL